MTVRKPLDALPEATAAGLRNMRRDAKLTQRECAELVGLGEHTRWSEYERGKAVISAERWALFLLAVGRHPKMRIAVRRACPAGFP